MRPLSTSPGGPKGGPESRKYASEASTPGGRTRWSRTTTSTSTRRVPARKTGSGGAWTNKSTSGASIVRTAFGERKETLTHAVPWTTDEAQARASAHFRQIARTFVTARGVADTDPGLRVGATVNLTGIGSILEGNYYVTEVSHLFDGDGGLRTEFAAERPGLASS